MLVNMQVDQVCSSSISSPRHTQMHRVPCNTRVAAWGMMKRALPGCARVQSTALGRAAHTQRWHRLVVCTYPEPETEKERSTIDFPQVCIGGVAAAHGWRHHERAWD